MKLRVSGRAYECCMAGSDVPEQEHWPKPVITHRGKGVSYVYNVDADMANLILSHIRDILEGSSGFDRDADTKADVAAMRAVLRNYESAIERCD